MRVTSIPHLTVRRLIRARPVRQDRRETGVGPVVGREPRHVVAVVTLVNGAAVITLEILRGRRLTTAAPASLPDGKI